MQRRPREVIEELWHRLPGDRAQRIKLIAASVVTVVCVCWLLYFTATSVSFRGRARAPDSPAHRVAAEMTRKLSERPSFNDVGVHVHTERPLKFQVAGTVHSVEELEALRLFLKDIRPENDFEVEVVVLSDS